MDILRMEELATFIESLPVCPAFGTIDSPTLERSFHMGTWSYVGGEGSTCGTTGCIAGWAVRHFGLIGKVDKIEGWDIYSPKSWAAVAGDYLGLDFETARRLFTPLRTDIDDITPKQAAAAIRQTYQTGDPNWELILQKA